MESPSNSPTNQSRKLLRIRGTVYSLQLLLGGGNFGRCYMYRSARGEEVAVKKMDKTGANLQEMQVHRKLEHPNIVQYINSMETNQHYFLAMEVCERSLYDVFRHENDNWDVSRVRLVFKGVLAALDYIHARNYVHRDIKLPNLLVHSKNLVKICDFGLVEKIGYPLNHFCGTLSYVSPEAINRSIEHVHPCVDIWSFGCCVFSFLNGCLPFKSSIKHETILRIKFRIFERSIDVLAKPGGVHLLGLIERIFNEDFKTRIASKELLDDPFFAEDQLAEDIPKSNPIIYQLNFKQRTDCHRILKRAILLQHIAYTNTNSITPVSVLSHITLSKKRLFYALSDGRYAVLYENGNTVMRSHYSASKDVQSFGLDGKIIAEMDPIMSQTIDSFNTEMSQLYDDCPPIVNQPPNKEFVVGYVKTQTIRVMLFSNKNIEITADMDTYIINGHGAQCLPVDGPNLDKIPNILKTVQQVLDTIGT